MDTIHLISHTHWDREWYLTFQQFRLKFIHLMDRLLEILTNDNDFKYFLLDGQTSILEDYLQIRPEREPDLARHIKNGRILIGPWYVSPDEFLIAPESHIRNLLEGDKLCQKYGGKMTIGYLPDSFGHIGQMPQILQGFGINSACLWRGLDDQLCELIWQSPDGSKVLLAYLRDSYSNGAGLATANPDRFIHDVDEHAASLSPFSMTGQILLMHGTDHMEPPEDLSAAISYYQINATHNNLMHSTLPIYFDTIRSQLKLLGNQIPVITGELRSSRRVALLPNVLSTRIWLKQRNHDCENELLKWIEPLNVWTKLFITPLPVTEQGNNSTHSDILKNQNSIIRYAWKLLMQCHPHDSICGTSIDQVASEMRVRFDQVDQINQELINQCLLRISDQIDTILDDASLPIAEQPNLLSTIVVFNPNDLIQTDLINLNFKVDIPVRAFEIIDDHGNIIMNDQMGMGSQELISMVADRKTLKQILGMIHEGVAAGMVIRDFDIDQQDKQVYIRATLSDHGEVDVTKWRAGVAQLELILADPNMNEYIIHAYSDPGINLSMIARNVPGHGYRCFWIRSRSDQIPVKPQTFKLNPFTQKLLPLVTRVLQNRNISRLVLRKKDQSVHSRNIIENEHIRVEARHTDDAISITDKRSDTVYTGHNRFVDGADCGDVYNYCPPERDVIVTAKIKKIEQENRNTAQKLIITYELNLPTRISNDRKSRCHELISTPIRSVITVVPGIPRIDIHTEIENLACDHRLRVHFPVPFISEYSFQDGHFEIVQRKTGISEYDESWEEPPRPEVPQCQFTSIFNDQISLMIANRGLPEVEVFKNGTGNAEIAVTLLRCIGWLSRDDLTTRRGHAGPMGIITPDAQMIGIYSFDYSVIPGDNHWRKSIQHAHAFNAPLKSVTTAIHPGILPSKCSLIENLNANFVITTIKSAEDDLGFIVRGYNILSSPIDLSLKLHISFKYAHLVGIDEKPIEGLPISPQSVVNLRVDGNKIITLRFHN